MDIFNPRAERLIEFSSNLAYSLSKVYSDEGTFSDFKCQPKLSLVKEGKDLKHCLIQFNNSKRLKYIYFKTAVDIFPSGYEAYRVDVYSEIYGSRKEDLGFIDSIPVYEFKIHTEHILIDKIKLLILDRTKYNRSIYVKLSPVVSLSDKIFSFLYWIWKRKILRRPLVC